MAAIKTFCDYSVDPATRMPVWGGKVVQYADPASFEVLNNYWARDKKHVFTGPMRLRGLNPKTVRALNLSYATDGAVVATFSGILKEADAESFRVLDEIGAVPEARVETGNWLAQGFAVDKNTVWFYGEGCGPAKKLKGADPASFQALEFGFGKDSQTVFLHTYRVKKADPETFVVLDCAFARDKARVFYGQMELKGADPESFEIVDFKERIGRDASGYWKHENRISAPE